LYIANTAIPQTKATNADTGSWFKRAITINERYIIINIVCCFTVALSWFIFQNNNTNNKTKAIKMEKLSQSEFDQITLNVVKSSIWAFLIPIAAGITGEVFQLSGWFFFTIALLTTFAGNRWFYRGQGNLNMFIPIAMITIVIFAVVQFTFYISEKRDIRLQNVTQQEVQDVRIYR